MKNYFLLALLSLMLCCAHKEEKKDHKTTVEITLADAKCMIPVVSSKYYFESYNRADKKKRIIDTKILDGRTTIYTGIYDEGQKYVFSIKKQPDSKLVLKQTVKFKGQQKIKLYLRVCD